MNILDWGCGSGNLAEVLYRNRYKANAYLGLDIRSKTIEANKEKYQEVPWVQFGVCDLVNTNGHYKSDVEWDFICSFEVAEHIGKSNVPKFLDNIKERMKPKTRLLISTPCYDSDVGAADNHTYDCGDGNGEIPQELTYQEFKLLLADRFKIINHYGTFASQKDYKPHMEDWQKKMYEALKSYYDTNLVSVMMAPMFPQFSRNCVWECSL